MSTKNQCPPDARLAMLFDRLVRRIHVSLQLAAQEFDTEKIGQGGAMILLTLNDLREATLGDLSRALVRDKSQMTRAVARLEDKGLVQRRPNAGDARSVLLALTEKGRSVVLTHQMAIDQAVNGQLTNLTEEDRRALHVLLEKAVR